jgi:hypothetical protein
LEKLDKEPSKRPITGIKTTRTFMEAVEPNALHHGRGYFIGVRSSKFQVGQERLAHYSDGIFSILI